jgi:hypothetical protein
VLTLEEAEPGRTSLPDCEHRDVAITHRLAAAVWLRRGKSAADDLHALADALADGLELEIDWPASER